MHADVHDLEIYDTEVCLFLVRLICELCLRIGEITSYDLGFLSAIFLDGCGQIKIHVPSLNKTDNVALMQ